MGAVSVSMASAPPPISSPRSAAGRGATSTPSRAPAMSRPGSGRVARRALGWRFGRGSARATRCRDHLRTGRSVGSDRARGRSQRRPRRLWRHPHERHPAFPYSLLWEERQRCICRQSDAPRRHRISRHRAPEPASRRQPPSIRWRAQTKRWPISRPAAFQGAAVLVPQSE